MNNRQLIKSAHIWAITALLALGLWGLAGKAGSRMQDQNSNQNSNTGNSNRTQNDNAKKTAKPDTGATGTQGSMSSQDRNFVMDAAMGGLMEVQLGRWAAQKGTDDAVKQFGRRMVDDHSKANEELMALAQSKGLTPPSSLDEKHQKEVAKLTAMSGAEFDRTYVKLMVSDHEKDVKEFERQSAKGADPDIKAFAAKTLPTLQEHLQLARALPGAPGGGNSNSNSGGGNSNRNNNGNSNRP